MMTDVEGVFRSSPAVSDGRFSQVTGAQSVPLSCPSGPASSPQSLQSSAPTNLLSVPPSLFQTSSAPPQLHLSPPSGTTLSTFTVESWIVDKLEPVSQVCIIWPIKFSSAETNI